MEQLKTIINKIKQLSFEEIANTYKDYFNDQLKEYEQQEDYDKTLRKADWEQSDKLAVLDVIKNIQNNNYIFKDADKDKLDTFIRKIDKYFKVDNFINNYKSNKTDLIKLFNETKLNSDYIIARGNLSLVGTLLSHFPNLYGIIKHIQYPNEYPIY